MLDELMNITSTEPYKSCGGMKVIDISITPWNTQGRFVFEIWIDEYGNGDIMTQRWEISCIDLAQTDGIPQVIIPGTLLKLYNKHPLLWHLDDEIYFTITSKANNIPALMGELFIEHTKVCGNWVDFHWLYASLPETLETLRENQLGIPAQLKDNCFQIFERYGVQYRINKVQPKEFQYCVLFFSNDNIWPDEENYKQPYIIAKEFSERRIS
jgi:hypothetical protein